MAYFIILPVFILWLLAAVAAILAARLVPRLAPIYPYVLGISLWATLGFLVANAVLIGLLALGFLVLDRPSAPASAPRDAAQIAWGLTALGGPVIASAFGWLAGCALGGIIAFLRARRLPPNSSFKPKPLRGSA